MANTQRQENQTEHRVSTTEYDDDLSPSTFGIDGIDDREDAAEADLDERVDELWGWSP